MEGNYTQNTHCEWLIRPKGGGGFITLTLTRFSTECSYDYLFVYDDGDGDGVDNGTLLASFSGDSAGGLSVTASSGAVRVVFFSDTNYALSGFRAEYATHDCPGGCSRRGTCAGGACRCHRGWTGPDCSEDACPDDCGAQFGRGRCMLSTEEEEEAEANDTAACSCEEGFSGDDCSWEADNPIGNTWTSFTVKAGDAFAPRAEHDSVYLEGPDAVFVYGG